MKVKMRLRTVSVYISEIYSSVVVMSEIRLTLPYVYIIMIRKIY